MEKPTAIPHWDMMSPRRVGRAWLPWQIHRNPSDPYVFWFYLRWVSRLTQIIGGNHASRTDMLRNIQEYNSSRLPPCAHMCTISYIYIQYLYISIHVHVCWRLIGLSISKCWRCKKTNEPDQLWARKFFHHPKSGHLRLQGIHWIRFDFAFQIHRGISKSIGKPSSQWETMRNLKPTQKPVDVMCSSHNGTIYSTPPAFFWVGKTEKAPFSEHLSIHQSGLIFGDWFPPCFGG